MSQELEKINLSLQKSQVKPQSFKSQDSFHPKTSENRNWNFSLTFPQILVISLSIILLVLMILYGFLEDQTAVEQSKEQKHIKQLAENVKNKKNQTLPLTVKQNIDITVVVINRLRYDLLVRSIDSFNTFNTYPIKKMIVVEDGGKNQDIQKIMGKYPNITWLFTQQNVGQLMAIDKACKNIETQFYFMFDGDYEFIKKGFIQEGLNIIKSDYRLSSVVMANWEGSQISHCTILQNINCTFSFKPGFHRLSTYKKLPNSYSRLTKNYSYGFAAGDSQLAIGYNYHLIGKHIYIYPEDFAVRIGPGVALPLKKVHNPEILGKDYDSLKESQKAQYKISYSWREMNQIHNQLVKNAKIEARQGLFMEIIPKYQYMGQQLSQYGIDKQVQLHSQFDYMSLVKTKFYRDFIEKYSKLYSYQSQRFVSETQNKETQKKKESLSITFCIMIQGTLQQYQNSKFQSLLNFIKDQPYNQTSLALVGSNEAMDEASKKIQQLKIKERINFISLNKDVNNYTSPGMFHFVRDFCRKDSVIVNLRPTDQLHSMAFRVIWEAFLNPNLMFATFKTKTNIKTDNLDKSILNRFRAENDKDLASFLKAYRYRLVIPNAISYLTEFIYSGNSKAFFPHFYQTSSDDFQTYLLIQMAGTNGVEFFNQSLATRSLPSFKQTCQYEKQAYVNTKARIKTPVKALTSLIGEIKAIENYTVPSNHMKKLKENYKRYIKCLIKKNYEKSKQKVSQKKP